MPARKRSRRADGTIVSQSETSIDAKDDNVARYLLVLHMRAQGKTQAQVGAYLGKDERTIRRYEKCAREMGLVESATITPQEMVDEINNHFLGLKADSLDLKMQAKAENNGKLVLLCIKALRDLELAWIAALDRIGYFDNYSFPSPLPQNPRAALHQKISCEAQGDETGIAGRQTMEGEGDND
jgi:hypothetical protein